MELQKKHMEEAEVVQSYFSLVKITLSSFISLAKVLLFSNMHIISSIFICISLTGIK